MLQKQADADLGSSRILESVIQLSSQRLWSSEAEVPLGTRKV